MPLSIQGATPLKVYPRDLPNAFLVSLLSTVTMLIDLPPRDIEGRMSRCPEPESPTAALPNIKKGRSAEPAFTPKGAEVNIVNWEGNYIYPTTLLS